VKDATIAAVAGAVNTGAGTPSGRSEDTDATSPAPGPQDLRGGAEAEAQRALDQRPRITVAVRIAAVFCVLFALMAGITAVAIVLISELNSKQGLLEKAASYEFEIQQARRYEKNFFLYGTNLHDALNSVHSAAAIVDRNEEALRAVIGAGSLRRLRDDLGAYGSSLDRLLELGTQPAGATSSERMRIESELRRLGAQIVADAQDLLEGERIEMRATFHTSMVAAFGVLAFMLLVLALVAVFLTRTLLQPLGRFMAYMDRIGAGDYSPITPVRRYRDEFSNLAMAVNRMLHEIKVHQERLVQSEKMAAVGTLTSGIAHELNNPLNNISLNTEALVEEFDTFSDEERVRMLGQIHTQVERASATVRQLLDFTRREQPVFAAVAVPRLVESTARLLANELALAHVEVRLEIQDGLPEVMGNPRNLEQVLLNLMVNATQAMPEGGTLTVRVGREDTFVRIDVADTGVGIPEDVLPKIFDPFFTTKEMGKGTGLGLAVTYGIIEKHKGRITVSSEVGKGTTFSVFVPAVAARRS
jgi:two-component system NtrC family sensor kinase